MRWWLVLIILIGLIGTASAMGPHIYTRHGMQEMAKPEIVPKHAPLWAEENCTHNQTRMQNMTCIREGTPKVVERPKIVERRIMEVRMEKRIHEMRQRMLGIKERIENAKMRYEKAREMYMKLRRHGLTNPETFRYAKMFLYYGIDYVEGWLERLMVQVQNVNMGEDQKERLMERIQNFLMALNESKNAINTSKSPEELRNAVAELRKTWNEIRIEIKSIVGQIAVAKLETVVEKAKDVTLKLEAEVDALNSSDVEKIKDLLNDCNEKLDEANAKLDEAKVKFEEMLNSTNPNELYVEGRLLLMEARTLIVEAFKDIREIFYDIKHLSVGQVFFGNETGELLVVGTGNAEVHFSGIAVVDVNGSVRVTPSTCVISVVGMSKSEENGTLTASGHGKIVVRGKNVTLSVDGELFRMFVKGSGAATLNGQGIYKLKKSPKAVMVTETFGNVTVEFGVIE